MNWRDRFERLFRPRSAVDSADRLIAQGNEAEAHGRLEEAQDAYRRAIALAPRHARAHLNLGIVLQAAGNADAALQAYETALRHDASDPFVQYNFATLLVARGEAARAEELLNRALERKPDLAQARVALSNLLDEQGHAAAAERQLEIVLQQRPDYAGAWYNYGVLLTKAHRHADALHAAQRACELDPGSLPSLRLQGNLLRSNGRIDDALQVLSAARQLAPARFDIESLELLTLSLAESATEETIAARHRAFGKRLEQAIPSRFAPFRARSRDPGRMLRVGYVSSDFYRHPVAWFMLPVLERHDRSVIRSHCYSTNPEPDEVTRQIESRCDAWLDAHALSDDELADRIHADGIDILVDLTGHAGIMRLGVFAQQPAPVQVAWLGYLNTTGLSRIRYRLCDAHTDPPGLTEGLHSETLVRLPHSQWCYRPVARFAHVTEPPCVQAGYVTFGSFNHAPKLSRAVTRLWREILARVPTARLVIVGIPPGAIRDRLLQDFAAGGIEPSRLSLVPRVGLDEYFRWFNAVDIALDTTPYSGGTTTCDALWMSVPVLTLPGARSVSRSAASILTEVGLTPWIAQSPDDYVRLAVQYACDASSLAELRGSVHERIERSPIMDEAGFAGDLERAYRSMWLAWCSSGAP